MRIALTVTTDAASEPITLTEVKAHLRITGTDDDTWLTNAISAARRWAEGFLNKSITARTLTANFSDADGREAYMTLPYPPVASITSVTAYTYSGDTDVLTDYEVTRGPEAQVRLSGGYALDGQTSYEIVYVTNATAFNASIKQGLLILVADMYEQRTSLPEAANENAKMYLTPFKIVTI